MQDTVPIRRALLSVSDKAGIVEFARALAERGVELISTGGTARALSDAGLSVTKVGDLTGFPEIMGGRVKTLHPKVHGGLLAIRDDADHQQAMAEHGIEPIDLVCINLYPFERTIAREGVTRAEAIEQIDIGGPAMIRASAKNHAWVTIATSPDHYPRILADLDAHNNATTQTLRADLAAAAFARTAQYDAAITAYLTTDDNADLPGSILGIVQDRTLRYGENPHQPACVYLNANAAGPSVMRAEQLHGKELSYNNLLDGAAALELVAQLAAMLRTQSRSDTAACVVKHTNPCGASVAPTQADAVAAAIAGDPMAAYGGILAISHELDGPAAELIAAPDRFFEVVVAPSYTVHAARILSERWKNVRLLAVGDLAEGWSTTEVELRGTPSELLVQRRDRLPTDPMSWTLAAGDEPGEQIRRAAGALELIGRALSSNTIAIGGYDNDAVRLFGAGAGQMDRVASCKLAITKAGDHARGAIAYSDAFFPFPDGPELLIDAGVKVIVHPGGAKRDQETFDLCASRGVSVLTTGTRRFRH
ncbi:MAG: bifunctional phosphoribosylaminoimidazolecarboxamide formyltransferase/IMP cyclohydrolase [Planctomycetota bacterium]